MKITNLQMGVKHGKPAQTGECTVVVDESKKYTVSLIMAISKQMWSTANVLMETKEIDYSYAYSIPYSTTRICRSTPLSASLDNYNPNGRDVVIKIIESSPNKTINQKLMGSGYNFLMYWMIKSLPNEILKHLINRGINLKFKNEKDETALDIAISTQNEEITLLILNKLNEEENKTRRREITSCLYDLYGLSIDVIEIILSYCSKL
jgi:hypothetical protein